VQAVEAMITLFSAVEQVDLRQEQLVHLLVNNLLSWLVVVGLLLLQLTEMVVWAAFLVAAMALRERLPQLLEQVVEDIQGFLLAQFFNLTQF
jgi:hypothetical protein